MLFQEPGNLIALPDAQAGARIDEVDDHGVPMTTPTIQHTLCGGVAGVAWYSRRF
jgi:hypothetical protein